jgi:hypothetical protein
MDTSVPISLQPLFKWLGHLHICFHVWLAFTDASYTASQTGTWLEGGLKRIRQPYAVSAAFSGSISLAFPWFLASFLLASEGKREALKGKERHWREKWDVVKDRWRKAGDTSSPQSIGHLVSRPCGPRGMVGWVSDAHLLLLSKRLCGAHTASQNNIGNPCHP